MAATPKYAPTVVIENFYPSIEGGRYPVKRVLEEPLDVYADIFKDGHDILTARLRWRKVGTRRWFEAPMAAIDGDRWHGQCRFSSLGRWEYVVEAWPDSFRSWKKTFAVRVQSGDPDAPIEALEGARLLSDAAKRARADGAHDASDQIEECADLLAKLPPNELLDVLLSDALQALMDRFPDTEFASQSQPFGVIAERQLARFSAWYEFFPRGAEGRADKHSGFRDCVARLDDAKAMGFDVIYFPPIHPVGVTARKGKNNTLTAGPDDVGSPWAIGGPTGGHRDIEPALGTEGDFLWLIEQAKLRGLEIALDFALNCSPDHPYVKDHPDWFYQRPDGSIRYAENPPKKYQDIYPLNFHCADWKNLWRELIDVVKYWVDRGVRTFRVDNPHTKPVAFWEELIATIHRTHPDVMFLSEAFTKPRMMQSLAKAGFTQSYTYFTWRESREELIEYATELTRTDMRWYFRGNFWPNTPDILPGHLQNASPAMFRIRAALASLLSSCWGMYSGYEFCENDPYPGKEEYNHSEKYELKERDWNAPGNIKGFITALNRVRRENAAMHLYDNLVFHGCDHPGILCFSKATPDLSNRILCILNLSPSEVASSNVHLDLGALGLGSDQGFKVTDLMHGQTFSWQGAVNYVSLDPSSINLHVFRVDA